MSEHSQYRPHSRVCVVSRLDLGQQPDFDRLIRVKNIDYRAVRAMIDQCGHEHKDRCGPTTWNQPLKFFHLVHCESRRIVPMQEPCKYVALSYVWGKPGSTPGGQSTFPPTIEDSIEVTIQLGFAYLWVDRYCIDQSNDSQKMTQIQQMGQIYNQASLVIFAAAGTDPSYGLPGISKPRTDPPGAVITGKYKTVPVPEDPFCLVSDSVWATRGWTYQEGFLSRRRLFFTASQLLFECEWSRCEELAFDKGLHKIQPIPTERPEGYRSLREFHRRIKDFSSRQLGYVEDRLRAYLGVLASFSAAPQPIYHIWGVPVVSNLQGEWQLCLNDLVTTTPSYRNPMFPSWSWLGWAGQSDERVRYSDEVEATSSMVEENGQTVELSPTLLQRYYSVGKSPEAAPTVLRFEGMTFPIFAAEDISPSPGCKLEKLCLRGTSPQHRVMTGSEWTMPDGADKLHWACWKNRYSRWIFAELKVIDRSFIDDLSGVEKMELLGVATSKPGSNPHYYSILQAVEGGYETVGCLNLMVRPLSTIVVDKGNFESLQSDKLEDYFPHGTQEMIRWL
ncbi:HET-domain-containing protein [Apiospora kogelbergensis]|uniref:HET-domain-containing protein n=1 Tax=Apiospora kogelbergensis TaxID=1337665 RepID=A0AAW0QUC9_9PEZI